MKFNELENLLKLGKLWLPSVPSKDTHRHHRDHHLNFPQIFPHITLDSSACRTQCTAAPNIRMSVCACPERGEKGRAIHWWRDQFYYEKFFLATPVPNQWRLGVRENWLFQTIRSKTKKKKSSISPCAPTYTHSPTSNREAGQSSLIESTIMMIIITGRRPLWRAKQ